MTPAAAKGQILAGGGEGRLELTGIEGDVHHDVQ
jgi:hypothetical protein